MAELGDVDMSDAKELGAGVKVLPPGEYQVYIESSERKATKKGDGELLECVLVVCNGEYENSKLYARFNLWNPNPQAVEIAKSQWRSFCEATLGQPNALNNDSTSLHSRPFYVLVDNLPAYNKDTGKNDHPTYRTNEIVFRKGTIRGLSSGPAAAPSIVKAAAPVVAQAAPVAATATVPSTAPAPTQTAATAVKPGTGTPPWKR